MTEILRQLGQLFVQSIPTVILVFILLFILDRIFFRPLTAILKQREDATRGALARARERAAAAEEKSRQHEAALQAARQEIYRQRETQRRQALEERDRQLSRARAESEAFLKKQLDDLARQVEAAKRELGETTHPLAASITEAVLSASASPPRSEGAQR